MNKHYDAPIMILFFNRPDTLKKVFEWVRKMQPKQLFLVQDGARTTVPEDAEKIEACRKVVENVDWDCTVYKNYATENMSCDHREYTGISWCFEYVDRLIILEDDCVPADSFYGFCAELLERYKNDTRIHSIAGFNRTGKYEDTPYDYVFSRASAGIGWATWKRCWNHVQSIQSLDFVDDQAFMDYYNSRISGQSEFLKNVLLRAGAVRQIDREKGKYSSWEYLSGISAILNNQLCITPKYNMIQYVGITEDATHCTADVNLLSNKVRRVLLQKANELPHPIQHPPAVVCDTYFEQKDHDAIYTNKYVMRWQLLWSRVKYGQWESIGKAISKRLHKQKR